MVETRVLEDKLEHDEEDFRSCFDDEDELKESEELSRLDPVDNLDEHSVRLYFKGVSAAGPGDSFASELSGIGVVMERSGNASPLRVQKKLDFYVEKSVADYLALLEGLSVAIRNHITRVYAFTDSQFLHDQITLAEAVESPLHLALRERITEQTSHLETFVLQLVPTAKLHEASRLACVAIGIVSPPLDDGGPTTETCSICCDEKLRPMMLTIRCSHRFCSHCMKTYVETKLGSGQVPIVCPHANCTHHVSASECSSFLPVSLFESLEEALEAANVSCRIYCPHPSCSALIDADEWLESSAAENACLECRGCGGLVCVSCGVRWHFSMTCLEYRSLPPEEKEEAEGSTVSGSSRVERWRRCQRCRRMIELAHGGYHMTCWCGHEFCYSCGAEYSVGRPTCECSFLLDYHPTHESVTAYPTQELEQWAWDSFEPLPMNMDAYSDQERSQLVLIHRFLAGGLGLTSHQPHQSPPRCTDSYADAMKDLHQLPWLERFVSVISDNYYEGYIE